MVRPYVETSFNECGLLLPKIHQRQKITSFGFPLIVVNNRLTSARHGCPGCPRTMIFARQEFARQLHTSGHSIWMLIVRTAVTTPADIYLSYGASKSG